MDTSPTCTATTVDGLPCRAKPAPGKTVCRSHDGDTTWGSRNVTVCKARKTNGEPCRASAIKGGTVCRFHGGSTQWAKRKAAERIAQAKVEEEARKKAALFGARRDIEPSAALLELVQWTAGEVEFWRDRVRSVAEERGADALTWGETKAEFGTDKGQPLDVRVEEATAHIYYKMLYAAQDRLAQYAAAALRAGVEERRVRLAEQQGDLVATAIRRILGALGLSAEQEALVATVVPRELRAISDRKAG